MDSSVQTNDEYLHNIFQASIENLILSSAYCRSSKPPARLPRFLPFSTFVLSRPSFFRSSISIPDCVFPFFSISTSAALFPTLSRFHRTTNEPATSSCAVCGRYFIKIFSIAPQYRRNHQTAPNRSLQDKPALLKAMIVG